MRIKNCGRAASCVPRDDRDTLVRHKALRIWVRHKALRIWVRRQAISADRRDRTGGAYRDLMNRLVVPAASRTQTLPQYFALIACAAVGGILWPSKVSRGGPMWKNDGPPVIPLRVRIARWGGLHPWGCLPPHHA